MADEKLAPGTEVRFTKDIIEGATGDHPTLVHADKGATGVIERVCTVGFDYAVKATRGGSFLVHASEIEKI